MSRYLFAALALAGAVALSAGVERPAGAEVGTALAPGEMDFQVGQTTCKLINYASTMNCQIVGATTGTCTGSYFGCCVVTGQVSHSACNQQGAYKQVRNYNTGYNVHLENKDCVQWQTGLICSCSYGWCSGATQNIGNCGFKQGIFPGC